MSALPSQCRNYFSLTDASRKTGHESSGLCDYPGKSCSRAEWAGSNWYRVYGEAGSRIVSASPGGNHCGNYYSGI